jgi:hypothetical protein
MAFGNALAFRQATSKPPGMESNAVLSEFVQMEPMATTAYYVIYMQWQDGGMCI